MNGKTNNVSYGTYYGLTKYNTIELSNKLFITVAGLRFSNWIVLSDLKSRTFIFYIYPILDSNKYILFQYSAIAET